MTSMSALPFTPYRQAEVLNQAWVVFKRSYGLLLVGTVVILGANWVLSIAGSIIQMMFAFIAHGTNAVQWAPALATLLWQLATAIFLAGPLQTSSVYVGAAAWRNEPISMNVLFKGFYRYWRSVALYWLFALFMLLFAIPVAIVIVPLALLIEHTSGAWWSIVLVVLASLAALIVFFYLYVRAGFANFLAIDDQAGDIGALDAMKLSWNWTRPHAMSLLGLAIINGLLILLTAACLFLPMIFFGMPLALAISGAAYIQIGVSAGKFPQAHTCPKCFYDLRGIDSPICPECGTDIPAEVRRPMPQ